MFDSQGNDFRKYQRQYLNFFEIFVGIGFIHQSKRKGTEQTLSFSLLICTVSVNVNF